MNGAVRPECTLPRREGVAVDNISYRGFLGKLIAGQREGRGAMPFFLGLQPLALMWLAQRYLPEGYCASGVARGARETGSTAWERGELRQELLELRRDEWADIRDLLLAHCAGCDPLEVYMADMVAAGCLGGDHLWRDLGLQSRAELGKLMDLFFPQLAAKNDRDMKWKKFFYKQLCEREGGYVCRAPTCEECAAYDDCFGEEV